MCLACMEYVKGNLTDSEFKKNFSEFPDTDHDPMVLEAVGLLEKPGEE